MELKVGRKYVAVKKTYVYWIRLMNGLRDVVCGCTGRHNILFDWNHQSLFHLLVVVNGRRWGLVGGCWTYLLSFSTLSPFDWMWNETALFLLSSNEFMHTDNFILSTLIRTDTATPRPVPTPHSPSSPLCSLRCMEGCWTRCRPDRRYIPQNHMLNY